MAQKAYPRIMQLSVKKNSGALGVKICRLRNGTAPITIARNCNTHVSTFQLKDHDLTKKKLKDHVINK